MQLLHVTSSTQWPEIVSCLGMMLDGDQLLDVVDTDENEWWRDWRDWWVFIVIVELLLMALGRLKFADEPVRAGRTHMKLFVCFAVFSLG